MKRFYDAVSTRALDKGGWQVTLDGRGLKTVKGTQQVVPAQGLASMLAAEWDGQSEDLDPASFPARDMVDYAIDVVSPNPAEIADKVLTYGDTDTLLYRADPEDALFARQQEVWDPIVADFERREGVELTRVSGIMHRAQSETAMARLRERLTALNPFALAGIELMTNLAASCVIGLSASETEQEADAIALWEAASLEEEWQADLWGRDLDAEDRRAKRQLDFLSARAITRLVLN